ncbi:MAG: AAA family ATPase [Rhizobiaceae bacterium]
MRYVFGTYVLDNDRHELIDGGKVVKLRPKVFRVLSYLITHSDRMVPKAELLDEIWPRFVSEEVLNSTIMVARRAIGDDGKNQKKIKTLHGLGFRFVESVQECIDTEEAESPLVSAEQLPNNNTQNILETSLTIDAGTFDYKDEIQPTVTEHKTVTVLACAIRNSEDLAYLLGPEAMHDFMESLFAHTQTIMERHGGNVVQWHGDGFLALFGAPVAHEDDARRSALSALELCTVLNEFCNDHAGTEIRSDHLVSIGLHTGPVIVGGIEKTQDAKIYTARGKTTDIAMMLQSQAEAGSVLVSEDTHKLLEGEVEAELHTKEGDQPASYRLLAISQRHAGVPRRPKNQFDNFVGRQEELAILEERLSRAATGNGQVVSISGTAGIGKSRLVSEFCSGKMGASTRVLRGQCLAYGSSTPYMPIVDLVCELLKITNIEDTALVKTSVEQYIKENEINTELTPLLHNLLGVAVDQELFRGFSPHARRMQTFELLYDMFLRQSRRQTLVMVVEDMHWIDATSETWIDKFFSLINEVGILIILTYRPSYKAEWLGRAAATQLSLPPLKDGDSKRLIRSIRDEISEDFADILINRAGGNPFFLEELTSSVGAEKPETIPNTVQAVLAARIDRLEPHQKQLLQTCSVVGTPVFFDVISHLFGLGAEELERALIDLEEAGFLFEMRETFPRSYRFKHALTQDATYLGLPQKFRKSMHANIAMILEEHFGRLVESNPEVLARHYSNAGNVESAIRYWQRAARQAYERSSNIEAVEYAKEGLALLAHEGDGTENLEKELSLQLSLAPAMMAVKGYGTPEAEPVYLRAKALCKKIGDEKQLFRTQIGLWNYHWVRGEFTTTRKVARTLVQLAEKSNDPLRKQRAYSAMGEFLFHAGQLEKARENLELGIANYKQADQPSFASKIPEVVCLCYASWAHWHTGDADKSLDYSMQAEDLAREISHPLSLTLCLSLISEFHQFRVEIQKCMDAADEAIILSQTHGLPFWEGTSMVNLGWAQAMAGNLDAGQIYVEKGLEVFSATGARVQLPTWYGMLAEILFHQGRYEEGKRMAQDGLEWVNRTGENHYCSELYRVMGELLLTEKNGKQTKEARNAFKQAISIAKKQGAKMREIRARTSLARHLSEFGHAEEAFEIMNDHNQWLRTAADVDDVRRARALMDELS